MNDKRRGIKPMLFGQGTEQRRTFRAESIERPAERDKARVGPPPRTNLRIAVGHDIVCLVVTAHDRRRAPREQVDHLVLLRPEADEIAPDDDFLNPPRRRVR
jgi:hypothetical protein